MRFQRRKPHLHLCFQRIKDSLYLYFQRLQPHLYMRFQRIKDSLYLYLFSKAKASFIHAFSKDQGLFTLAFSKAVNSPDSDISYSSLNDGSPTCWHSVFAPKSHLRPYFEKASRRNDSDITSSMEILNHIYMFKMPLELNAILF